MKLREEVMEYQVRYHGTEYEDPYKPIAGICPECQSQDIRESTDDDGTLADWVCNACGCKFDSHVTWKRTKLGNVIHTLIQCMIALLFVAMVVCMIGGMVWFAYKKREFGVDADDMPGIYQVKAMAITIVGPLVCGFLIGIMCKIENRI